MPKVRVLAFGAGIIILVLFAWFVWPTPYYYSEMKLDSNIYPVRINRFTNSTKLLLPSGWEDLDPKERPTRKQAQSLPATETSKLEGQGSIRGSSFMANLYNGTDYTITHLDIRLTVKNGDGSVRFSRKYQIWCTRPENKGVTLTSSEYSCDLGEYLSSYYYNPQFDWSILTVYGYKE